MRISIPGDMSAGSTIFLILTISTWVCGVVFAKGLWSTFFSVILAPYAWYLFAEYFLNYL